MQLDIRAFAIGMCCLTTATFARTTGQERPAARVAADTRGEVTVVADDDAPDLVLPGAPEEFAGIEDDGPERPGSRPAHRRKEKVAFLGIATTDPTPALRSQLRLAPGTGLLVEQVLSDSPAEKAGLRRFDVLQKLDDQLLVDQRQLSVLIRLHRPGDDIKLTVVREGAPQTLSVKLDEKELSPLDEAKHPWHMPWPGMHGIPWHDMFRAPHDREHRRPPQEGAEHPRVLPPTTGPANGSVHTWVEDGTTYTLTTHGGHRYLGATRDGQQLFQGLVDTSEQIDKLPSDIREKVKKALRESGSEDRR